MFCNSNLRSLIIVGALVMCSRMQRLLCLEELRREATSCCASLAFAAYSAVNESCSGKRPCKIDRSKSRAKVYRFVCCSCNIVLVNLMTVFQSIVGVPEFTKHSLYVHLNRTSAQQDHSLRLDKGSSHKPIIEYTACKSIRFELHLM